MMLTLEIILAEGTTVHLCWRLAQHLPMGLSVNTFPTTRYARQGPQS